MHLLIIDGLNLIRRIHAVAGGVSEDQVISQSLERCSATIARLMQQFQPSHAVVCFDGPELSWRHHEYPNYKLGRKPKPVGLLQSLTAFRQQFAQDGIASLALATVEADDLAATLTQKMLSTEGAVTLVSTDKGFAQLLSPNEEDQQLTLWNHFDRKVTDIESVKEKFGVLPWQLTDYWGLVGDSTNNIPGVKGIGPKSAVELIHQYQTLEQIYQHLSQLSSKRQQALLTASEEKAYLSRRLATLDQVLELGCSLKDFRCKTGSYQNN